MAKKKPSRTGRSSKAHLPMTIQGMPVGHEEQRPLRGDPEFARLTLWEILRVPTGAWAFGAPQTQAMRDRLKAEIDRRTWSGFHDQSYWLGYRHTLETNPRRVAGNQALQILLKRYQTEGTGIIDPRTGIRTTNPIYNRLGYRHPVQPGEYHVPVDIPEGAPWVLPLGFTPRPRPVQPGEHVKSERRVGDTQFASDAPSSKAAWRKANTILTPKRRTTIMK